MHLRVMWAAKIITCTSISRWAGSYCRQYAQRKLGHIPICFPFFKRRKEVVGVVVERVFGLIWLARVYLAWKRKGAKRLKGPKLRLKEQYFEFGLEDRFRPFYVFVVWIFFGSTVSLLNLWNRQRILRMYSFQIAYKNFLFPTFVPHYYLIFRKN